MAVTSTLQYGITIDMRYTQTVEAPFGETTPVFKNIRIENFTCGNSKQALYVMGLNESRVENVVFKDVTIKAAKGAHLEYVNGFTRENVKITPTSGQEWELLNATESKP
jgi:hypothetical protein